jgi:hypothetical protein
VIFIPKLRKSVVKMYHPINLKLFLLKTIEKLMDKHVMDSVLSALKPFA